MASNAPDSNPTSQPSLQAMLARLKGMGAGEPENNKTAEAPAAPAAKPAPAPLPYGAPVSLATARQCVEAGKESAT
ncbi:MAG: hypothetical protein K2R98_13160, partial [Gemmataceae bacterium]|nr:hypothetical protein [Gemmataceae bacterium]